MTFSNNGWRTHRAGRLVCAGTVRGAGTWKDKLYLESDCRREVPAGYAPAVCRGLLDGSRASYSFEVLSVR